MKGLSVLDWAMRVLLVALVAGGISVGAFFVVRTSGGEDAQVVAQLIETPTPPAPTDTPPPPTPTATELPPTQPAPTQAPPTDVPPATEPPPTAEQTKWPALPTLPTPLRPQITMDDVRAVGLPRPDQLQIGPDGRYLVEDYLGCRWEEWSRDAVTPEQTDVLLVTDCSSEFHLVYFIELGEFSIVAP